MFLARWNGTHRYTAWVRGRRARTQRCDPSREQGRRALGAPQGRDVLSGMNEVVL